MIYVVQRIDYIEFHKERPTVMGVPVLELDDKEHRKLIFAQHHGATLSVANGKVIASDYRGVQINLDTLSDKSNFSAPM